MEVSDVEAMDGASVPAVTQQEKMVPQSVVNQIVAREKAQVAERVRQQMMEQAQSGQQSMGAGNKPGVDVEQLKREIYDKIMGEAQEAQAKRQEEEHKAAMIEVADSYHKKMGSGKDAYPDFDDVMGDFNVSAFPKIVFLASQLDNTADVMYELAKNPMKLASIDHLADKNPVEAQKMLRSLGNSIQQNRTAMQQGNATLAPLSRTKSSPGAGTGSGGDMSLKDYKNAPWLRG